MDEASAENALDGAPFGVDPARVPLLHPRVRALYDHWCRIRPGTDLPGSRHFALSDVPDADPNIWIVDVVGEPPRFRYRRMGANLVRIFEDDFSGRWLDELHPDFMTRPGLGDRMHHIRETGRPSWRLAVPVMRDANWAQVESLMLPLADDGRTVDTLFCMSIWHGLDGQEV